MADDLPLHWILHEIDEEAARHDSELVKLPELRRVQDQRVAAERRRVDTSRARMAELDKQRRALEGELDVFAASEKKFRAQLDLVTTQQQFEAVQHEIAGVEGKRSEVETRVLTIMDEEDSLRGSLPALEEALAKATRESESVHARLAGEEEVLREKLAALDARRSAATGRLEPAARARYERARTSRAGRAVAAIDKGACGACFSGLSPNALNEAKRRDKLLLCDGCGRMLLLPPDGSAGA
ncbi:MAG: hypothetical protein IT348_05290 [Candidatus Eisenbacteria bacterium]|nr:hypothetical protein [Candidatus Eisenbacteria bacterium]